MRISYYTGIDTLPLYNFNKYRKDRNVNWFRVGYNGGELRNTDDKLVDIEKIVLEEYFKAIDDRSFVNRLHKIAKIESMRLKYVVVKSLVSRLWKGFGDDAEKRLLYIKELARHGFKMPELNTLEGDMNALIDLDTACEGIKTGIIIIENELKLNEQIEEVSLERQLQIATIGLNYPHRLNPKEITVLDWIEICKLLDEKSKKN